MQRMPTGFNSETCSANRLGQPGTCRPKPMGFWGEKYFSGTDQYIKQVPGRAIVPVGTPTPRGPPGHNRTRPSLVPKALDEIYRHELLRQIPPGGIVTSAPQCPIDAHAGNLQLLCNLGWRPAGGLELLDLIDRDRRLAALLNSRSLDLLAIPFELALLSSDWSRTRRIHRACRGKHLPAAVEGIDRLLGGLEGPHPWPATSRTMSCRSPDRPGQAVDPGDHQLVAFTQEGSVAEID